MARYFFNLCNGQGLSQDNEGQELPDLDAVRANAIRGLRSVLADECLKGELHVAAFIEVINERRQVIANVGFADAISIVEKNGEGR